MKSQLLEKLNADYKSFFDEYLKIPLPLVLGDGNVDSPIVLVGEAPGKNEVQQGKPFVGQAGKNLTEFINILNISREDLYITNTVKFRPSKINPDTNRESNRTPTKEEVAVSKEFIIRELQIIKPKLIVTLGNTALKCLKNDDKASIGELHGVPEDIIYQDTKAVLFPLYHPASIIYKRELKDVYIEDLHKLKQYIKDNNII